MRIAQRLFAVFGIPALLAGFVLAGSAAAKPAPKAGPSFPYTVTFTANVIGGTTTVTIDSTACNLKGAGGNNHSCFLGGAGSDANDVASGSASITGNGFGPIALTLTQETSNCADGTALVVTPSGPVTVNAKLTVTNATLTSETTATVKGTIKIGPGVTSCPLCPKLTVCVVGQAGSLRPTNGFVGKRTFA